MIVALDAARERNDRASCAAAVATDRKNEAEARFAAEVHRWLYTAFAAHGRRAVCRDVRPWRADLSPSRWLDRAPRARLADLPGLLLFARDLAPIADLDQAGQALKAAVTAWEAARRAHAVTSAAAEAAIRTFDRRYGVLVRAAQAVDPDGVGAVPTGGPASAGQTRLRPRSRLRLRSRRARRRARRRAGRAGAAGGRGAPEGPREPPGSRWVTARRRRSRWRRWVPRTCRSSSARSRGPGRPTTATRSLCVATGGGERRLHRGVLLP